MNGSLWYVLVLDGCSTRMCGLGVIKDVRWQSLTFENMCNLAPEWLVSTFDSSLGWNVYDAICSMRIRIFDGRVHMYIRLADSALCMLNASLVRTVYSWKVKINGIWKFFLEFLKRFFFSLKSNNIVTNLYF